jgi:hypothetical protein
LYLDVIGRLHTFRVLHYSQLYLSQHRAASVSAHNMICLITQQHLSLQMLFLYVQYRHLFLDSGLSAVSICFHTHQHLSLHSAASLSLHDQHQMFLQSTPRSIFSLHLSLHPAAPVSTSGSICLCTQQYLSV